MVVHENFNLQIIFSLEVFATLVGTPKRFYSLYYSAHPAQPTVDTEPVVVDTSHSGRIPWCTYRLGQLRRFRHLRRWSRRMSNIGSKNFG